jgi:hypothetical protein
MIQFAEQFQDEQIVATLSRQLGWSHFVEIIALDDPLQREFYAEMCRVERWSVLTPRSKIQGMLSEYLTALRPREVLEKKLHEAIRAARERLSLTAGGSGVER